MSTVRIQEARMPADELIEVDLRVNGVDHRVTIAGCMTLLDALHHELGLTGTKKACDMGACGACTVLSAPRAEGGNRRIASCLTLAAAHEGDDITTIEGIGTLDALHPLQDAFVRFDALQCGFCTPGQIVSGIALLAEGVTDANDLREALSGNLCRCGAYPNIVAAILDAAGLLADTPINSAAKISKGATR
jgi:xanthine dehydrogenase YagT iron-sulfur-binding subunit